jgi:rRNA maturation endonuclease Nob1
MTLQEPRGDETKEEELQRLGIQGEEKKLKKKILLISDFDEWYGPIYRCPFCAEETIWDDFNFCPACGGSMEEHGFETIEEDRKRMAREKRKRIVKENE